MTIILFKGTTQLLGKVLTFLLKKTGNGSVTLGQQDNAELKREVILLRLIAKEALDAYEKIVHEDSLADRQIEEICQEHLRE